MSIKRGKRHSLILEVGRWRFRAVPGRHLWGWERNYRYGGWAGVLSTRFLLVSFMQRGKHSPAQEV